jgi:hypothetical protein
MRNKYFPTLFFICILTFFSNFAYSQNIAPVLSNIEETTISYTEGDSPADITNNLNISDPDDDSLQSATIQITSGYQNGEDILDFASFGGISGSWISSTGTLTLTGGTTINNYRSALRSVSYVNTNTEDPSTATRTVTFRVYDGEDYSNTQWRDISVTAVNDAPVLADIELTPLEYTEEDPPATVTSEITVTDPDDLIIDSAIIRITTNYQDSEDVLNFTNTFFITGTWNPVTGILKLTGSTTIARYQTALRDISYENTNTDDPFTLTRTVTFRVHDGDNYSNTLQRNINVTAVNDDPVLSAIEGPGLSYAEEDGQVDITNTITVTDADDINIESATIEITSNYLESEDVLDYTNALGITGTWNSSTGILTLNGSATLANYQIALRNVSYENTNTDDPYDLTRTVTFSVNDGNANSNIQSRNIYITASNDAPVLSDIETIPLAYTEGSPPVIITSSIVVTDVDNNNMVNAQIELTENYENTEDVLIFTNIYNITSSWNSGQGRLSLSGIDTKEHYQQALRSVRYSNTNTEDPSTLTRTVTFRIFDGTDYSNIPTRDITISTENDPPVLSAIESTPVTYTENNPPVILTSSIIVEDIDDDNIDSATVRLTTNYLSTEDRLNFSSKPNITGFWNSSTGILSLTGTDTKAAYQAALRSITYVNTNLADPSTLVRTAAFTVNDGDINSNTLSRAIIVTAVNDLPELSGIETAALSYTEDMGPLDITNTLVVTDIDDDSLELATIRITNNYVPAEDTLIFTDTPGITSTWSQTWGRLTLTGPDSKSSFQSALRNVAYINKNTGNPSLLVRTATFRVNDGDGYSNTESRNITIARVNDPPELSDIETYPLSYSEGSGEVKITGTILVEDVDDTNIESATIQITGNYDNTEDTLIFTNTGSITSSWTQYNGTLILNGSTTKANYQVALRNVRYKNKDTLNIATVTRTVTFIVNDGDIISNMQSRNINVTEENDPPVATSVNISGSFIVNTSLTGLYGYNDPEGDPEGSSVYMWYRSDYADGTDSVEISGADEIIYLTKSADGGKYLSFGVIPVDNRGAVSPYIYNSGWKYINDGPVALNLHIAGAKAINQTDTADFDYFDLEGDPENTYNHYYQWYRADNLSGSNSIPIPGQTNKTYTITNNDNHKFISVKVVPVATTGTLLGDTAQSIWYGPISNLPSATITGTDTICPYGEAEITISYIGENPPWSVTYTVDGSDSYTISDIEEDEVSFLASTPGVYELETISDDRYKDVKIEGFVTISLYEVPTVVLSGIVTEICDDGVSVGILQADFTGEAPWSITVDRPGIPDTIYTDITDDPFAFNVLNQGIYRIIALSDSNCTGDVTGSGSVLVIHQESPQATISGIDTICPGDTAYLTVTLDDGYLPWQFTYTVNGLNPTTVFNINTQTYTLEVYDAGEYELESVQDPLCTGRTFGTGLIYYRSVPTATLTGGGDVCQGIASNITVTLTGAAPWNFKYKITSDTTIYDVNNVLSSPRQIQVSEEGWYILTEVEDKYCTGTVSGTVRIEIIEVDPVTLSGLQQAYSFQDDPVPLSGDPEGGTFSGPGLITSNDTTYFLPGWAGITEEDDPPHQIVYSYQFWPSGCFGRDTANVRVLSTTASIIFPDNKTFYCYNDDPFIVEGFNIFKNPEDTSMVIGEFSISAGEALVDHGNNTATVYPEILQDGIFTITYSKSNGNSFEETEQFEVQYVDDIYIIGFTEYEYCSNDPDVKLNGNVSEGIFYGNSVAETPTGFYFVPSYAPAGKDTIFYSYTTPQGCSRVTFDTAFIYDSPAVDFAVDDLCIALVTNDSTVFINNTTSSDPVIEWLWNFGDPRSGENTSTLKNPKHLYSSSGSKQVSLTAETDVGCRSTETELISFGDVPVADFNWESECYLSGIPIQFTNNSTSDEGTITSHTWKFYRDEAYSLSSDENPEITYSNYGDYDVELVVETEFQCIDTVVKTLHLRKTIVVEAGYFENFEQGVSGWYPHYINNSEFITNSWTYGEPEGGFSGAASGVNAWYTNIEPVETTSPSEKSWVTSPCFDFRNTKRPIIKLDIWRLFDETRDGAVLQYSMDSSKTWQNVGDLQDGINWYNEYNIPVKPGDNSVGWSDLTDSKWAEARHKLDNLKGLTNVQFRIAYGSDGSAIGNDGIAFDDIWIGENKKTVLIEHFTNTLETECTECKEADNVLNNIVNHSNDVIDIQYHTSFPEGDPFYLHNTESSGAREVYYSLSDVPYSMMDGGFTNAHKFDYELKTIEEAVIDTQVLKEPLFDLKLITDNTGNSINIECALTALSDIPESWISLYIVVIEREITQITEENEEEIYENVVKKMLPYPSGTSYTKSWASGEHVDVNYSWTFTNVFDAEEVRVVAFVQDENTREIYQAAIDKSDWWTSINDGIYITQPLKIIVYPNPTGGTTYVKFNQPVNEKCRIELYNNMGKLLYSDEIYKGEDLVYLNTENFNNGLYILRIADRKRVIDVKKLIISR